MVDIRKSLRFWRDLCSFAVAFDRLDEGFAYLDLDGGGEARRDLDLDPVLEHGAPAEEALGLLVEEDVPCVLVPMDLTHRCAVDTEWLAKLAASWGVIPPVR